MPLTYLSNFWRTVEIPLINCEASLTLTWSENCVLTSKATREADPDVNPAVDEINNPTNATFKITNCKLYIPVVTLSAENGNKLLEQLKAGSKKTIKWNKYRSEMSNQTKNSNLNYLIDPTFTKLNRLFVLSFENETDRTSFSKYYVPKVETKDFNVLTDGKPFLEIPVKNKEEAYKNIIEMSKNNDYTTDNLLDYEYFKDHYQLIAIDLSKQMELENFDLKQQINFTGRLEENNATMFFFIEKKVFFIEKKEETTFHFFTKFCSCCLICIKMETQKIINLLNDCNNESSKFATRKWYIINDQNNRQYGRGNGNDSTIKSETKVIKPNLCYYSDAYILVTGDIKVADVAASTNIMLHLKIVLFLQDV